MANEIKRQYELDVDDMLYLADNGDVYIKGNVSFHLDLKDTMIVNDKGSIYKITKVILEATEVIDV